jgi:hypothetical protein
VISRLNHSDTIKKRSSSGQPTAPRTGRAKGAGSRRHAPRVGLILDHEVGAIENAVQAFSTNELLQRYHELIDRRLAGGLQVMESFELDRIESRLNAEDEDEVSHLAGFQKEWQLERREIVADIEMLLVRLKNVA